jgi:hypothetical protein
MVSKPSTPQAQTKVKARKVVENNGIITTLGGITGKGFLPGHSGNVGGRPKGLAALSQAIFERTGHGLQLVEWYVGIWRGEKQPLGKKPTDAQRLEAAQWLTERGWGKAPVQIDVSSPSVIIVTGNGDAD